MQASSFVPQLFLALLAVVGLMLALSLAAKRWPLKRNQDAGLRLLSSISIGSREKLVVVAFDNRRLLLGVTPQSIHTLSAAQAGTPAAVSAAVPMLELENAE